MLEDTKCTKFLHTTHYAVQVGELKKSKPDLESWLVPEYEDMISQDAARFPYDKTYEEAGNDPVVILHTSGSTGKFISSFTLISVIMYSPLG